MADGLRKMRVPRQIIGTAASVNDAIGGVGCPLDPRAAVESMNAQAPLVPLPVELDVRAGARVHWELLGELVGALVLISDDVESVGEAVTGVPWGELGFVLWMTSWATSHRNAVLGLAQSARFERTCVSLEKGEFSPALRDIAENSVEDMVAAWEPEGST